MTERMTIAEIEAQVKLRQCNRFWSLDTRVRKKRGSSWQGRVVGYYSTSLTPIGYCVESEREPGSVQIYPQDALEKVPEGTPRDLAKVVEALKATFIVNMLRAFPDQTHETIKAEIDGIVAALEKVDE